ncbi:MAG: Na+:solute symporter [Bacteroidetes bacterium]|nr:Na+:solute symporter [Bacteroidota bacterium]
MHLSIWDFVVVAFFLLIILSVGLSYTNKAGKDLTSYFLAGRNLPWYLAGISMVATTFAADTPLAVTELVNANGIAGNWLWWSFLAGGLLTTFFFANLWRKADVLTEVELIELRYSGKEAAALRGFKSIYLGLFMNVVIIAWVNVALMSLLEVFFELSHLQAFLYTGLAMLFVAVYASLSGLLGVVMTDVIQFVIAMIGCIVLAIFVMTSEQIGGVTGLKTQLNAIDPSILNFLPTVGSGGGVGTTLGLSVAAFFTYATVQWWASWYPGAEPGGGGYIAQRMMSAKSEKDAVYATLFFQIAHYCIRPWPWILVGLAALVLYPELSGDTAKLGYVYAMRDFLPNGFKGLLLVAFFSAYMSTISTQLNWGSSYLVNDFYKRFLRKNDSKNEDNQQLVMASRITTFIVMVIAFGVTYQLDSIKGAWSFIMQCGAGLGMVLILRWYWWRINAWSEISATIAPFIVIGFVYIIKASGGASEATMTFLDTFPNVFLITVAFTTVVWLLVTIITPPTSQEKLNEFYNKVQPMGNWTPFQKAGGENGTMGYAVLSWLLAIIFTYGVLFLIGKLILMEWQEATIIGAIVLVSFVALSKTIDKTSIFK